jgi:peroxiredoxin
MRSHHYLFVACVAIVAVFGLMGSRSVLAQGKDEDANRLLEQFRSTWEGVTWEPQAGRRLGYLRPLDDSGWKQRMAALQRFVQAGPAAAQPLREALASDDGSIRALAAQALGLLKSQVARGELEKAAQLDKDEAVRLAAIDALGMIGGNESDDLLRRLQMSEQNRDVKQHIAYALERNGKPLDDSFVNLLKQWNPKRVASAKVGEAAPDFELPSLAGDIVRLGAFRGKSAVVLVFVYGDTCPVCHGQLAQLRNRLGDLQKAGAQLLVVDAHEAWPAKHFLKDIGLESGEIGYPLLLDAAHLVSATYGVAFQNRIHTELSNRSATFIIDRDGVIRYARLAKSFSDRPSPDEILAELKKL